MAESRLILNNVTMSIPLYVAGTTWCGIGISGTWVGTIAFSGSFDGVNYVPLDALPWPTGTPTVQSATANGSWYVPTENFVTIQASLTVYTSGSPIVQLVASSDASFRNAFLTQAQKYRNSFAYEAVNTMTIAADPNGAWRLRTLVISTDAVPTWASSPALQVKDGSTLIYAIDPPLVAGSYLVPLPTDPNAPNAAGGGLVGTPGNAMTITLASSLGSSSSSASSAGGRTNIDAQVAAA